MHGWHYTLFEDICYLFYVCGIAALGHGLLNKEDVINNKKRYSNKSL